MKLKIAIIIVLGLIPLFWWKPGYIIAKGDYFPWWFDPERTLPYDIYVWSAQNFGNPSTMSSALLQETLWFSSFPPD